MHKAKSSKQDGSAGVGLQGKQRASAKSMLLKRRKPVNSLQVASGKRSLSILRGTSPLGLLIYFEILSVWSLQRSCALICLSRRPRTHVREIQRSCTRNRITRNFTRRVLVSRQATRRNSSTPIEQALQYVLEEDGHAAAYV